MKLKKVLYWYMFGIKYYIDIICVGCMYIDNDDDLEEDIDIASAVKKELKTEYKYISWMNGDFGNVLIYIKRNDIDPGTLLNRVFKNTYPKYPNLSPHVLRLYPVFTCYRDQKNLMNLAQKIINMHFKNNNDINMDKTFGIFFKKKVTGIKMDRKELIDNIAKMFPIKKVNLSEPDYALILKPFGVKSFIIFSIFHIHSLYIKHI